ncbi:phage tail protein [Clostridium botulinum]|uniref:phage tail protein n=1 Tax=Clostridium botulinum TaxID=1491 RepID=UPI0019684D03|nr:phage tail tape measure protein [Clostridium botulinum]MBN1058545.1 phage tail tape measure protein [Clostridium botulinum]
MSDGKIIIDTKIDSSGAEKGIKSLSGKLGSLAKGGLSVFTKGVMAISTALGGAGIASVKLASDLTEVQNVVDTTFGDNASKINEWAKSASTSFGMSELEAKQFNGTMGAMLKSMGLTSNEVLNMSEDMTGLAGDFASFYNLDTKEAFDKIRSGISGETEPLKQLGINMSVANLEAFALSQGINKQYKEMTQAEQATLRYNYLMSVSADAQGDFAKTSDTLANQLRIAKLGLQDLGATIGQSLIPQATEAITGLNGMVEQLKTAFTEGGFNGLAESLGSVFAQIITKISEQAPTLINMGVTVIQSFLQGIQDNLPQIADGAIGIVTSLVTGIIDTLPQLLEVGVQAISELGNGIAEALPELIPKAIDCILTLVDNMVDNIDMLIDVGVKIIIAIAEGLIQSLPTLIEKVPTIINKFWEAFDRNLGKILQAGIKLIIKLGEGIIQSIPLIIANAGEICKAILNTIIHLDLLSVGKSLITKLGTGIKEMGGSIINVAKGIGKNIIDGIKSGLSAGVGALKTKALEIGVVVKNSFKDFFNIHSPSRLMRDLIGKNIIAGISVGMENELPNAINVAKEICTKLNNTFKEELNKENAQSYIDSIYNWGGSFAVLAEELQNAKDAVSIANEKSIDDNKWYRDAKYRLEDTKAQLEELQEKISDTEDKTTKESLQKKEKALQKQQKVIQKEVDYYKEASQQEIDIAKENAKKQLEIANEKKDKLIQLSKAVTDALKERLAKEKSSVLDKIAEEEKAEEEAYNKKIARIDKVTNRKIENLKRQQKALDEQKESENREEELQKSKDSINVLKTKMANTSSLSEKKAIALKIADEEKAISKKQDDWRREDEKARIQQEIDKAQEKANRRKERLKEDFEESKKHLEKKKKNVEEYYKTLLETDNLNAQARYMLLTNSNEQLVQLLNSYAPNWQNAGQSLGDSLINGLNSKRQEMADAVREMTSLRSGSLDGYAKGTSYNARSGLYDTDEKGFELSTKGSVAYVSRGAGILNHMQSLNAIKNEVSNQMSVYADKLRNAVKADQMRIGQLALAGVGGYSNSNTTTDNSTHYGSLLHADKIEVRSDNDIEQLANELGIYAKRNKKC